jgi:4-hydroxy-tetrahydrodipicolinate synthase
MFGNTTECVDRARHELVSPLVRHAEDEAGPDTGALLELLDMLMKAGVDGIALFGATGEFTTLDLESRARLAYLGVKRSRVPVLVSVAHASLEGALELGREAAAAGAAGLLLMPPYFYRYAQAEVREFCLQFAERLAGAAPVYLYNIPAFTNEIALETARDLLGTGLFAGIKDSSGCFEYFEGLKDLPINFVVGHDAMFARARVAGATGAVSGVACAVPELMLGLDRAINAGLDTTTLETRLGEFLAWADRFPVPVAIKAALAARGVKIGPFAVPMAAGGRRAIEEFQHWFRAWLPTLMKARHA